MNDNITICTAQVSDASEMLAVYTYYVEKTAVTFEYDVPALEEFAGRIHTTLQRYPYLVAREAGEILGYAYAGPFKGRAAYDWSVETTVYVREDQKRRGIGQMLYAELEGLLKKQGILNMYACIAYPMEADVYLTRDSVKFHEKMGFQMVGQFHNCGNKFGNWYHMVWMEKELGKHEKNPKGIVFYPEIEF